MLRILIVCNAVLALFLAVRLANTPVMAAAVAEPGWSATALRIAPVVERGRRPVGSPAVPREVLLHLGHEVGPQELPFGPLDLGLEIEPRLDVVATWHDRRTLRLLAAREPLPATAYRVRFARGLRAADGRELPPGTAVVWATPTVSLQQVLVEDDPGAAPGRGAARLVVAFDQALDLATARRQLEVLDGVSRQRLPIAVATAGRGDGTSFRLQRLDGELPPQVRVVLGRGTVPQLGTLPTPQEQARDVAVYEPLEWRSVQAYDGALVLRFSRVVHQVVAELVTVTPAVPVTVTADGDADVVVRGDFQPGSLVTVALAGTFPGRGRSSLLAAGQRTVLIPDRAPRVEFAAPGEVLSSLAEPFLPLRGCNVDSVLLRILPVYPNNVVRLLQSRDGRVFAPAIERRLPIAAARNVEWQERVDLRPWLGPQPQGFYEVELSRPGRWWPERRLLQITDLGMTVRAGAESAAVQVVSIADGVPRSGVAIAVYSPTNQELARAVTDGDGIARLRWPGGAPDRTAYAVVGEAGADRVVVGLEQFAVELADEGLGGRPYLRQGNEAMVWPSRGIVRPGERFDVAVLVRGPDGMATSDAPLQLRLGMPGGRELRRLPLRLPVAGLAGVSAELPLDAPCGRWSARVLDAEDRVLGEAAFEVAAFVPNRLEAEVAVRGDARLGAPLVAVVKGRWLDGTPAAEAPVTVRVHLRSGALQIPGAPGLTFAAGGDDVPPGELPLVEGVLDARGEAELRLPLPGGLAQQVLQAVVAAEVRDPAGRPVRTEVQTLAVVDGFLLGLAVVDGGVEVRACTPDGVAVPTPGVEVRLERRRWEHRYEDRGGSRWGWRAQVVRDVLHSQVVDLTDGQATVPCRAASQGGWLCVVATAGARRVECTLGKAPLAPDRLRVTAAGVPAPGELAWLDVESPAAGRGFVTLESDRLHTAAAVSLQAGHNRIAVPVPGDARLPNLHAVVTLTRGLAASRAGDGPAWLVGATDVRLRRDELALAVRLEVPPAVLPQAVVPVRVAAPGADVAVVAVVDEGVLALTQHRNPDPLGFLLASRRLAVDGADTGAHLLREMVFAPRSKSGGDDDDLASLLRGGSVDPRIRPLALFLEVPLREGVGQVDLSLPAYEGRVRVMVLAAGRQRCGAAAQPVVVKAPLGVQVAMPRAVLPGDRFLVPVTVRNDLGADTTVQLELQVPDGLTTPLGRRFDVVVANGRTASLDVPIEVGAGVAGTQTVTVAATAGAATRTVVGDFVVRPLRVPTVDHLGVALGAPRSLRLAEGFAAEALAIEARYDAGPDRQLRPALEAMLDYPYGCCEQTTSRGLALASCAALLPRLYDEPQQAPAVLPLVQAAVDRVLGMQSSRGGFGWWLSEAEDHPFLTTYVVDFLLLAKELGAEVPAGAFDRAVASLEELAKAELDLSLASHAVAVLARAGRPVGPRLAWLATQAIDGEARCQVAMALVRLGDRPRALTLLQHGDEGAAAGDEARRLASPVRAAAMRLRLRLELDPADPELPVEAMALQQILLRPRDLTTQESAQGLRALADYYRRQPTGPVGPAVTIQVDGRPFVLPLGRSVALPGRPGLEVAVPAGPAGFLLFAVRGQAPPVVRDDDRLVVRRRFVDLQTGQPATSLRRGRVYEVVVEGEAGVNLSDLAFVDLLPGGLEPEPAGAMPERDEESTDRSRPRPIAAHAEARDDRVLRFAAQVPAGRFVLRHRVRAVFPGDYTLPPLQVVGMYDPTLAITTDERVRVEVVR